LSRRKLVEGTKVENENYPQSETDIAMEKALGGEEEGGGEGEDER
jgi:hypothetical protein